METSNRVAVNVLGLWRGYEDFLTHPHFFRLQIRNGFEDLIHSDFVIFVAVSLNNGGEGITLLDGILEAFVRFIGSGNLGLDDRRSLLLRCYWAEQTFAQVQQFAADLLGVIQSFLVDFLDGFGDAFEILLGGVVASRFAG